MKKIKPKKSQTNCLLSIMIEITYILLKKLFVTKTSRESQNAAQRTSNQLSRCQNVLTKRHFESISSQIEICKI